MDLRRVFGMAILFGLVWVALAYFQSKITDWRQLAGGFLVFVIVGPAAAWLVRAGVQWWKGRQ